MTVSSTTTAVAGTTTTVSTYTHTVIGTTPAGQTVTEVSTHEVTTPAGPDGIAVESGTPLAALDPAIQGQLIDDIQCNRINQLAYPAYAHLLVVVHGQPEAVPGGIGLVLPRSSVNETTTTYSQSTCAYWLMTRAGNGVIQIHSPVRRRYTLGEFFDVWGQPLGPRQVAGAHGRVTAFVNGRRVRGNPREIPLREHEAIQLAVGTPVPRPVPVSWANSTL